MFMKNKTRKNKWKITLTGILLFLTLFFLQVTIWIPSNFGDVAFSQVLFHLLVPLEGADNSFVIDFIWNCVVIPIIVLFIFVYFINRKKENKGYFVFEIISKKKEKEVSFSFREFFLSVRRHSIFSTFIILVMSFVICINNIGLYTYAKEMLVKSEIFEKHYVNPANVKFDFPEQKRNLVYIFLESMETTYYDEDSGGVQEENLIPELYTLAQENITFQEKDNIDQGFYVAEGATWTIGAMVGQSSGIPLKIPIEGNSYESETFLPGAYSIGNILQNEGYNQELLIGSEAVFGGRKYYYELHGEYTIKDYEYAKKKNWIDQDYHEWWGYEDKKLFDFAKEELISLSQQEQPFNLTMLTADTHHIGGYPCPDCPTTYDEQFKNVIACSSKKIGDFIDWMKQQPFYENTSIVICGDHLSMDPTFFNDLEKGYKRKGYYTFINPAASKESERDVKMTSFDLFPTTLASLGVTYNSNRLGLGTNLFSGEKTLLELYGWDELQSELTKNSTLYNREILYKKK